MAENQSFDGRGVSIVRFALTLHVTGDVTVKAPGCGNRQPQDRELIEQFTLSGFEKERILARRAFNEDSETSPRAEDRYRLMLEGFIHLICEFLDQSRLNF